MNSFICKGIAALSLQNAVQKEIKQKKDFFLFFSLVGIHNGNAPRQFYGIRCRKVKKCILLQLPAAKLPDLL